MVLYLCPLTVGAVKQELPSPLASPGLKQKSAPNYTPEEIAELDALEAMVQRFIKSVELYRSSSRKMLEYKYDKRKDLMFNYYEQEVRQLEEEQRVSRLSAIRRFQKFIGNYPDGGPYTADAMFRLSELYFERSYDEFLTGQEDYDVAIDAWDPDSGEPEPELPAFRYEPTISMMQRLLTEYPDYRLIDGAYYLLGYCLGEQGEEDRSLEIYQDLVAYHPHTRFGSEVWMRIAEYHFNASRLAEALNGYKRVLGDEASPFFDKALYKLAWTHYRLADPEDAPEEYTNSVNRFVELLDFNLRTKAEGKERGGDLLKEAIQYIAITYSEENWGGLDKLVAFLDDMGERPYSRDVINALASIYFDQTLFDKAMPALKLVQERYPLHPDAPKVQEQIITAYERNRDFESAAKERDLFIASYSDGGEWQLANKENLEAVDYVAGYTQKAMYAASIFYHEQAQVLEEAGNIDLAVENYRKAAAGYGDYLERYPHDKQLYALTFYLADTLFYSLDFERAAVEFTKVREMRPDGEFLVDAASNIVFAYRQILTAAISNGEIEELAIKMSSEREEGVEIVPLEIPLLHKQYIDAIDILAEINPADENLPNFLYTTAQTYQGFDHLDEALKRFHRVLENYPTNEETAGFSVESLVDLYQTKRDYRTVAEFTKKIMDDPNFAANTDLLSSLQLYRTGAQFLVASELATADKHDEASALYVALVDENPTYANCDAALNNAAVSFEKSQRFDSAMKMYQRIVDDYPQSPRADGSLFRVGVNAQNFFDFEKALATYSKLVKEYPKSTSRPDAFYNIAFALEQLQQYKKAAKQYLAYCDVFPKRDDAPEVCFRAGEVYEKMDDPRLVRKTYLNFIKRYWQNEKHRDRVVEAHLRVAKSYEKQGNLKQMRKRFQIVLDEYNKKPDAKSALYAAEAEFKLLEPDYESYSEVKFVGNSDTQSKALVGQIETLKELSKKYGALLQYKQVEWMLAALYRQANLYQLLTEQMFASECPTEFKKLAREMGLYVEDLCDERLVLLEEQAIQFEDAAVQQYEQVIERSREYQIANEWTDATLVALNKLRKAEWPLQKPAKDYIEDVGYSSPRLLTNDGALYEPPPPPEPELIVEPEQTDAAPAEGEEAAAPAEGEEAAAPAEGEEAAAPAEGEEAAAPAEGEEAAAPAEGEEAAAPAEGEEAAAPAEGDAAPAEGDAASPGAEESDSEDGEASAEGEDAEPAEGDNSAADGESEETEGEAPADSDESATAGDEG
uniref:FOG: TPR repeat n=1 Tax=uncultured myxobacterium HF0130_06F04 TaxID=723555 RepID=E7C2F1_9BACT|nr:hypothetical protein [uncultured myxobacterium HF0130_06F04]